MRLLSIHIDDFGKISNFDMDLLTNPVIISEENGWGKSTLASFIKVMFYGFEGESKKKLAERERVKYKPWNKGNYGGRIIFESKGRECELTRHFGDKEKDDTASLLEVSTMLPCNDYEIQILGEELFGIDEESFVRTVFVGQGNMDVFGEKESIGDGIAARIGNLTDATDDLYNYEKIHEKLLAKSRELKSGHVKGIINECEAQITELKVNIAKGANVSESFAQIESLLKEKELEKDRLKNEEEKLDKELILAGKKDAVGLWNSQNNALQDEKNEIEQKISQCKAEVPGVIPGIEEIEAMQEQVQEWQKLKISLEQHPGRNVVGKGDFLDINENDVKHQMENYKVLEKAKKDLDSINYRIVTEEDRAEFVHEQQIEECKRRNRQLQDDYERKIDEAKSSVKNRAFLIAILGIVLLLGGVAGFVLVSLLTGGGFTIAGAVVLVIGLLYMNTGVKKAGNRIEKPELVQEPVYRKSEKLESMNTERENLVRDTKNLTNQINAFLTKCNIECSEQEIFQKLYELKESVVRKDTDVSLVKEYEEKSRKLGLIEKELEEWFDSTQISKGEDYAQAINRVSSIANQYYQLLERLKDNSIKLEQKEQQRPLGADEDYSAVRAFDEVRNLKGILEEDRARIENNIKTYVNQLGELGEKLEAIQEDEESLKAISEKLVESRHKYDIITQTVKFMETAKERLTSRYMNPISESFKKYYGYISEGDLEDYNIDANINITKNEFGERRNTTSLSRGYRDLIDVALRMALVDAMYEEEKPFVILDDPFMNLDTEKINKAKEFLSKISNDYQVIYFTCHDSRA